MVQMHQGRRFVLAAVALSSLASAPGVAKAHPGEESARPGESFTVAVIPDTQNYVDDTKPQPDSLETFLQETQYLAKHKRDLNLAFVTHVGDVVQHGDGTNGAPGDATYGAGREWTRAEQAMDFLAASGVPFGMTPGNHDYDNYSYTVGYQPLTSAVWTTHFGSRSSYFKGKHWYGGASDHLSYDPGLSSFQTFFAGGRRFLHISLQMEASDEALAWAQAVIDSHKGYPTLITTHEYLNPPADSDANLPLAQAAVRIPASPRYLEGSPGGWNDAQGVWQKLVAKNDQVFMVICGHAWGATVNHVSKSENLRIDLNQAGHPVYQVLSDYQGNTAASTGGDGWLRLMEFDLPSGTIHFRSYSPTLEKYAGQNGEATFNEPPEFSDFVLPVPPQVLADSKPWSFGIISDTQWTEVDDGRNPGTSAVDIINQVNQRFIEHGVDLVVAVGDLTDKASSANMDIRAVYAQALYNAGIGFFPLRGNHDSTDADEFVRVFPQTRTGWNNATPTDALSVANVDSARVPPAAVKGAPFALGADFSSPAAMPGKTYSFDYKNARFVLLDQFDGATSTLQPQQGWISQALSSREVGTHAFVFGHKGLITENHVDNLFGASPAVDPAGTDAFIKSLFANGARYYIGGHDHMHDRTQVWTTDARTAAVTELVCASDSSKFYLPAKPSNDVTYDLPAFGHTRQTALSQELNTVGYYVVTVDGPRATVHFYSAAVSTTAGSGENVIATTPKLSFTLRETFGYSLNGKEFVVAPGHSYTSVQDVHGSTHARILEGVNGSAGKDGSGRPFSHAVDTGWTARECGASSDTLHLWGMATELGSDETDVVAVSLSYDDRGAEREAAEGRFGLQAKSGEGRWVNAVDLDVGGDRRFVRGPWRSGYRLGTYGVDERAKTAWAVVNHAGEFRVGAFHPGERDEGCDLRARGDRR